MFGLYDSPHPDHNPGDRFLSPDEWNGDRFPSLLADTFIFEHLIKIC
jgi:hypothetical protein